MKVRPALLIQRDNKILVMHYRYGGEDVYALPGGNPDRGETLDVAVIRELQEELGVDVEVGPIAFAGEVMVPTAKDDILHVVFTGEITVGDPGLNPEHTTALAVVWMPVSELDSLNMYPNVGRQIQRWLNTRNNLEYIGKINQQFFG
ncbi:NUDIX domain-containing protein [Nibrella saemangeumensis]|uniref:NUDIX domain-containing protein n=1 Tax=Nibrella saemangeumensis TaxID=1084526 RepID=A0ABP8NA19_9BACT